MTKPTYDFSGKVALVTGATGGMGRAITAALAGAGASVMASDLAEPADGGPPGATAFTSADVSDGGQVAALVAATVERFGTLDYAVNAAAIEFETVSLAEVMDHADLEHTLEVQRRQAVLQHHGQQAQAPGVLGRAFAAAFGRVSAAQHVLELFGRLDEAQPVNQVLVGHGADSGTSPPVNRHTTVRVATIGTRHNHSREDTP